MASHIKSRPVAQAFDWFNFETGFLNDKTRIVCTDLKRSLERFGKFHWHH